MQVWLILCLALLFSTGEPIASEPVELFDTDKERVVQTYDNSQEFQEAAKGLLNSVSGRVLEFNPSLEHALIVKIPLVPPQRLVSHSAKIDEKIGEMFVILPKKGRKPWMILHTQEYQTLVLEFTGEVAGLKKLVRL
jgi:hypothetical protein